MRSVLLALALLLPSSPALIGQAAQSNTTQATAGLPAPLLHGNGTPVNSPWVCGSNIPNVGYVQDDAQSGKLWICESLDSGATWNWVHLLSPIQNIVTTQVIAAGSIVAAGSYTTVVSVPIASLDANGIPNQGCDIYPLGDPGALLIATAFVSGAGQVTVRITNLSLTAKTPNQIPWLITLYTKSTT